MQISDGRGVLMIPVDHAVIITPQQHTVSHHGTFPDGLLRRNVFSQSNCG